ncbi:exopolyphosphatase [Cesiribacter sp. SM1]|uniref:Ppx/GppA phosphatase family protein n=1 Tax=Cesiribacter sp. SM1 TaxID=2861196 RepID=UPI001CD33BD5|nr:exopolyphosphatase [Cesiribacter sp. SM1]
MRKVAVIDLGTNTFHLLIARIRGQKTELLHREKVAVKIGEGGINARIIIDEAQARAISALKHFSKIIEEHGIREVYATATSAIRNASNSKIITNKIFEETGIQVKVISGEEEAELIYFGVRRAMELGDEKSLIMDIGGGSVEFIIADAQKAYYRQSFEIGAQRLLDLFHHHDPMLPAEVENLEKYLHEKLGPLGKAVKRFRPTTLVGSSGSFDTLSEIYSLENGIERDLVATEFPLTLEACAAIHQELLVKDKAERLLIPGMIPLRVDMIVVASCLIQYVVKQFKLQNIRVSAYALKEGVLGQVITQPLTNIRKSAPSSTSRNFLGQSLS